MTTAPIFRVSAEIFERFPTYVVACVAVRGVDHNASRSQLDELIAASVHRARATYEGLDLKAEKPFAAWRDAFSQAGWSPSRYPASVEALHKRIQRGDDLPRINAAVDLANSAALYYAVPVGTHDISSFGDQLLEVRMSTPEDQFVAMNGTEESVDEGEIVYAVGHDVRTRRWVWRQGRNGLIASDVENVFFPIDGFTDRTCDAVLAAQNYLAELATDALGADVVTGLVDASNQEFSLS